MARGGPALIPVGDNMANGFDFGGARNYPMRSSLAIEPPVQYSSYIGSANSLPVASPVEASSVESGTTGAGRASGALSAMASPFGPGSPLPWVMIGLVGAVAAMHGMHYMGGK